MEDPEIHNGSVIRGYIYGLPIALAIWLVIVLLAVIVILSIP